MNIVTNFQNVVTKHYFDFEGRARRAEYWWYVLAVVIINVIFSVLGNISSIFGIVSMIVSLALFLPGLGIMFRRIHDTNRSAWWLLLILTGIGALVILFWFVQEGTKGANEYGPDPKA